MASTLNGPALVRLPLWRHAHVTILAFLDQAIWQMNCRSPNSPGCFWRRSPPTLRHACSSALGGIDSLSAILIVASNSQQCRQVSWYKHAAPQGFRRQNSRKLSCRDIAVNHYILCRHSCAPSRSAKYQIQLVAIGRRQRLQLPLTSSFLTISCSVKT